MIQDMKLGDLCEFINGGAWSDKEYVKDGIPVLKVSNFKPSGFILDDVSFLPKSSLDKYKKHLLLTGDLIIATVGSHPNLVNSAAGRSCIVTQEADGYLLNQNAVCIRTLDSEVLDQNFLCYFAKSHYFQHYIQSCGRGAANQMRIAISAIKDYKFDLPDIGIQRRIGDILATYDKLIENNQNQIKLLEEAAMRLYKEWFVKLRFPGYETTKIIDGIPEGWKKAATKHYMKFNYGKALKAEERTGKGYPVYGSSGIVGYHKTFLVEAPAIIVGRKGNVGSVFFSLDNTFPIDTVYFITSNLSPYYCYFELLSRTFVNSDAAVPGLNRTYAESMEMLCPSDIILHEFDNKVSVMLTLRYKLEQQIALLRQSRDILLPKLINGEIEV